MGNILKAIACVLSIGLLAMYFTSKPSLATENPSADIAELIKRNNELQSVAIKLFYRTERIEEKLKMQVPKELELKVNKPFK